MIMNKSLYANKVQKNSVSSPFEFLNAWYRHGFDVEFTGADALLFLKKYNFKKEKLQVTVQ